MAETQQNRSEQPSLSPTMDRLLSPKGCTGFERALIDRLRVDYAQPHRHHHTLEQHITPMVAFLDEHSASLANKKIAVWAALFHDSVYDPIAAHGENEQASALKFRKAFKSWVYESEIDQGEKFIIATADHIADPNDPDMQLFLDADLSVLGSSPAEYRQYAANIRAEYDFVPDSEYARARSEIIIGLLRRERIFVTDVAYEKLEAQARCNMVAELDHLEVW